MGVYLSSALINRNLGGDKRAILREMLALQRSKFSRRQDVRSVDTFVRSVLIFGNFIRANAVQKLPQACL
jgi:hypothetical protein